MENALAGGADLNTVDFPNNYDALCTMSVGERILKKRSKESLENSVTGNQQASIRNESLSGSCSIVL